MDTIEAKHEAAIYSSYRRTLKSLSTGGSRNSRAGARKQQARVLTAERYKVPISTVKNIVKAKDEERGIIHAPTANLIERRRIEELYGKALDRADLANPERNCTHCGGSPEDELQFPDGNTGLRGPAKVRLDQLHYSRSGEVRFLDVCLRCWVIELDNRLNNPVPIVWSSQAV